MFKFDQEKIMPYQKFSIQYSLKFKLMYQDPQQIIFYSSEYSSFYVFK